MANKNIEQFIATYGPVAQQVSKEINVDPNVLLSQWGLESRWGQTEMAKKYNNLGGIKDFSGKGLEAKDNKTGSVDKYVKFEDPEVFGMYYADQIKRNFPLAVNTGPDVGAFTRGLASGKNGSYFGIPVQEYESSLSSAQASIPENQMLPFEATEGAAAPAPAAPPQETDEQRDARMQAAIDAQEKRQAQMLGGGVGLGISGTKAVGAGAGAALQGAATRVGQGFRAGMQGGVPTTPATPTSPLQGGLSALDPNANQATRILQGTTGDEGTTGRARQQGYNEQTSQQAAQRKETEKLLAQLRQTGAVADDAPAFFARQPGMTSTPSGVVYPRSEPSPSLGPRGPQGQIGYSRPPAPPPPPPPSMYSKAISGLDAVTDMFKGLMRPVATAASTAGKYVLPPLALASAAGEGVNIAQQARKPEGQRDTTSMMLSGGNILGSGLSMFPPTAPVGIPLAIGTGAAQAYRDNPDFQEYIKRKMQGLANAPLLDEMTGPLP
jgi:hypothetical protein